MSSIETLQKLKTNSPSLYIQYLYPTWNGGYSWTNYSRIRNVFSSIYRKVINERQRKILNSTQSALRVAWLANFGLNLKRFMVLNTEMVESKKAITPSWNIFHLLNSIESKCLSWFYLQTDWKYVKTDSRDDWWWRYLGRRRTFWTFRNWNLCSHGVDQKRTWHFKIICQEGFSNRWFFILQSEISLKTWIREAYFHRIKFDTRNFWLHWLLSRPRQQSD